MEHGEEAEWTYVASGHTFGPVTRAQLDQAARAGYVDPRAPSRNVRTQQVQPVGVVLGWGAPPPAGASQPTRLGDDAGMRMLLPVGQSGWAIAAGYLGLVGWVIFFLGPFALVCAELGRRDIKAHAHKHGVGRVVVGYVGGAIGTVVLLAFLVSAVASG